MNANQTLAVAVRLFSIWLFLLGLSNLTGAYLEANKYRGDLLLWPFIAGFIALTVVCIVLWKSPMFISGRLIKGQSQEGASGGKTSDDWLSAGVSLIGLWAIVQSLPALLAYLAGNYLGRKFFSDTFVVTPDFLVICLFNALQLALGVWLFLGGRGINSWLRRLQRQD